MQRELGAVAQAERIDVAVQVNGLERRAKRLVVMDVDSTLIVDEVIELLADEAGCGDEVAAITARAMAGELDFEGSLRERVRLLAGLDEAAIDRVRARIRLTPGARTFVRTLKRLGFVVGIVSGGFTPFTDCLRVELGLDHAYANTLEVRDGRLTGEVLGPVVDRARKAELLAEIAARRGGAAVADRGRRRRRQRPRHARRGRAGHRLQRQAGGPGAGRHHGLGALPGRDPVHARHPRRRRRAA